MILQNYWDYCQAMAKLRDLSISQSYSISPTFKDITGTVMDAYVATNGMYQYIHPKCVQGLSIRVGSGDTAPSMSDYALDEDETSNFSNYSVSTTLSATNNGQGYEIAFLVTGTNNTNNTIILKEIGITHYYYFNSDKQILMVRYLMDSPITVAPGAGFSYACTWSEGVQ